MFLILRKKKIINITEDYGNGKKREDFSYVFKGMLNISNPVAEFSVSICSTPKFACGLDDDVPRLLITENDTSYRSNIYKNRMMWILHQFKNKFII